MIVIPVQMNYLEENRQFYILNVLVKKKVLSKFYDFKKSVDEPTDFKDFIETFGEKIASIRIESIFIGGKHVKLQVKHHEAIMNVKKSN